MKIWIILIERNKSNFNQYKKKLEAPNKGQMEKNKLKKQNKHPTVDMTHAALTNFHSSIFVKNILDFDSLTISHDFQKVYSVVFDKIKMNLKVINKVIWFFLNAEFTPRPFSNEWKKWRVGFYTYIAIYRTATLSILKLVQWIFFLLLKVGFCRIVVGWICICDKRLTAIYNLKNDNVFQNLDNKILIFDNRI